MTDAVFYLPLLRDLVGQNNSRVLIRNNASAEAR